MANHREAGAGIDGVLDAVTTAVSERLLRYDVAGERDFHDDFGWLDITHGMTYANAVRWHAERSPASVDVVRLALWTVFLANWTGRHEWHTAVAWREDIEPLTHAPRARGRPPRPQPAAVARGDADTARPRLAG